MCATPHLHHRLAVRPVPHSSPDGHPHRDVVIVCRTHAHAGGLDSVALRLEVHHHTAHEAVVRVPAVAEAGGEVQEGMARGAALEGAPIMQRDATIKKRVNSTWAGGPGGGGMRFMLSSGWPAGD